MTNLHILDIFRDVQDEIKNHWYNDRPLIETDSRFNFFRFDGSQDYIAISDDHPIQKLINLPAKDFSLVYLRSFPRSGLSPVHIDVSRACALNIPIEVDPNDSFCFIANKPCTERPFHENEIANEKAKRYLYEPENYDYYNLRNPCLLNTKVPHGFANFADTERVLLSISFIDPYEEVLKRLIDKT